MSTPSLVVLRLGLPKNPSDHPDAAVRRAYWRALKQAERDRKRLAGLSLSDRCPVRYGRGRCGGYLETGTDRIGRTVTSCARCERIAAGRCVCCPRPITGDRRRGAIYCEGCRARVWKAQRAAGNKRYNATRKGKRTRAKRARKASTQAKRAA